MREFGFENFKIEEIGTAEDSKTLKDLETQEIKSRNTIFPNGLNSNIGGTLGARDVETFVFESIEYRSLSDLGRKKGINPGTLQQRVTSYGMSLEQAVYFTQDHSIEWKDKTYLNLRVFCEEHNLNYARAKNLLWSSYPINEVFKRLTEQSQCLICGSEFKKKSSLNKFCSPQCRWKNKNKNRNNPSIGENKKRINHNDKAYSSVSEFCREMNMKRSSFSKLLVKYEYDVEKALEHYKNRIKRL
jgi:hypothetical protein